MVTRYSKLTEAGWGEPTEPYAIKPSTTAIKGVVEQTWGVYQIPSFRELVNVYWNDPLIKIAVDHFALQVVSTGIYASQMGKEYLVKLNNVTAIECIEHWNKVNQIQAKIYSIAVEMRAFGNSLWRLHPKYGFVNIPIESAWHVTKTLEDDPLQIKYRLQLTPLYNGEILESTEFAHFRINYTGYHAPLGMGIIMPLLARPARNVPSVYEVRLALRKSLTEGMLKFSYGNSYIGFPQMTNEDFDASNLASYVAGMKSTGNRIVTNTDVKVALEVPQRTESYNDFIKAMNSEFLMGVDNPVLKLGMQEGVYTKASSQSATQMFQFEIASMRAAIASTFEKIWSQVLENNGFDSVKADIRCNFGMEEIDPTLTDLTAFVQLKVISPRECRANLIKRVKLELDSADVPEDIVQDNISRNGVADSVSTTPTTGLKTRGGTMVEKTALPIIVTTVPLADAIARYSADGTKIYIDPLVPNWMHKPLIAHEVIEYQLEFGTGVGHEEAERMATIYEKHIAQSLGMDWEKYDSTFKDVLTKITVRGAKNPDDVVERSS